LNGSLISRSRVFEAKRHGGITESTKRSDERCFFLVLLCQTNLMVSGIAIQERQHRTSSGGVHHLVYPREPEGILSAFRDRGVPEPTSESAACPSPDGSSAWASAKGGTERARGRWPEPGRDEGDGDSRGLSCSSRAQVGCACSRGLQASARVRGASGPKRAPAPALVPARPTFSKKALVLPFISVRRGSRCTKWGCSKVLRV
jgi:hypothetical protein